MTKRFRAVTGFFTLLAVVLVSCMQVDMTLPKGPQGPQGPKGDKGLSAYEVWKAEVEKGNVPNWSKDASQMVDFLKYIQGKNGLDGKSALEIWQDQVAKGDLDDPHNPGQKWPKDKNSQVDFWWFLTGATGESGQTPHIGDNGNWFVGTEDTGISAKGKDGVTPTIEIKDGYWVINGVKTDTVAFGKDGKDGIDGQDGKDGIDGQDGKDGIDGQDGKDGIDGQNGKDGIDGQNGKDGIDGQDGQNGKSAFELWQDEVATGNLDDPHHPGQKWPADKNTKADFWEYLSGNCNCVAHPKVSAVPFFQDDKGNIELVSPLDGSVTFQVLDSKGNPVEGAKVTHLPGVKTPGTEYTTDAEGKFVVGSDELPWTDSEMERYGSCQVTLPGESEAVESTPTTFVPNQVRAQLMNEGRYTPRRCRATVTWRVDLYLRVYRKNAPGAEWTPIPNYLFDYYKDHKVSVYRTHRKTTPRPHRTPLSIAQTKESFRTMPNERFKVISVGVYRFMSQDNPYGRTAAYSNPINLSQKQQMPINEEIYLSAEADKDLYGHALYWDGTCQLPIYQTAPIIKSLEVTENGDGTVDLKGVLDFSMMDMTKIIKTEYLRSEMTPRGDFEMLTPEYFSEADAKDLRMVKVSFYTQSKQVDNSAKPCSFNDPTFELKGVPAGSTIYLWSIDPNNQHSAGNQQRFFMDTEVGVLSGSAGSYSVTLKNSDGYSPSYGPIVVTTKP